jgi:hypothetical protein
MMWEGENLLLDGALRGGLIGVIGGVGEVHVDAGRVEILGWDGLGIEVLRVLRFGFGVGFGEMKPSVMADGGERKGENSRYGAQVLVKLA